MDGAAALADDPWKRLLERLGESTIQIVKLGGKELVFPVTRKVEQVATALTTSHLHKLVVADNRIRSSTIETDFWSILASGMTNYQDSDVLSGPFPRRTGLAHKRPKMPLRRDYAIPASARGTKQR